jgi:hypothetical protein
MKMLTSTTATIALDEWTVDRLKSLSIPELEVLYRTLPAPSFEEMHGEYQGGYIGCEHPISNGLWKLVAWNSIIGGVWQGKSFEPLSETEGRGFNVLELYGRRIRKWPMRTTISISFVDDREVFLLDYPFYISGSGAVKMTDEVRKVNDGLYLGIGHWRPLVPMASLWFTLSGPVGPFDPGRLTFKKRVAYRT